MGFYLCCLKWTGFCRRYLFWSGRQLHQYTVCSCFSPAKHVRRMQCYITLRSKIYVFQTGQHTHVNAVSPRISSSQRWGSDEVSFSDILVHASTALCNSSCDVGLNTAKVGTTTQANETKKVLKLNMGAKATFNPREFVSKNLRPQHIGGHSHILVAKFLHIA